MPRPTWKGYISFGLVNVPVTLYSVEQRNDLSFHLLDSRNSARVRYERINEVTGEEVPWDKIVKGYEYSDGAYVLLSEEEFDRAAPELTKMIEIERFVELSEIDVRYFEKPYYLVPGAGGQKGYVLLREAMQQTGRVGIARVVIRARGYLAAMMPQGDAIVLELLRYQQEIRSLADYDFPKGKGDAKVTKKELGLALQLVEGMAGPWEPDQFQDEYRDALQKMIEKRIKAGDTNEAPEEEAEEEEEPATVNFMDVLKRSVAGASKGASSAAAKKPAGKSTKSKTRTKAKKKAKTRKSPRKRAS